MNQKTLLTLVAVSGVGLLGAELAVAQDACFKTSTLMRASCNLEIQEDFQEMLANCVNLSDEEESKECTTEARLERLDAFGECRDVRDARDEVCLALDDAGPYDPDIDPDDFVSPEEAAADPNPWWPLVPGNTWIYEGDGEVITVVVTDETREILGIDAIVVRDIVTEDGELVESTDDYYAQDTDGNVWYFGEISQNFEDGFLTDLEGSFIGGEDGAKPGILFFASPVVGTTYRQEFFLGDAEDIGEVISLNADGSSPFADCDGQCVLTRDYTPLEPGDEEFKYYRAGIGLLFEEKPEEDERVELVDFQPGG